MQSTSQEHPNTTNAPPAAPKIKLSFKRPNTASVPTTTSPNVTAKLNGNSSISNSSSSQSLSTNSPASTASPASSDQTGVKKGVKIKFKLAPPKSETSSLSVTLPNRPKTNGGVSENVTSNRVNGRVLPPKLTFSRPTSQPSFSSSSPSLQSPLTKTSATVTTTSSQSRTPRDIRGWGASPTASSGFPAGAPGGPGKGQSTYRPATDGQLRSMYMYSPNTTTTTSTSSHSTSRHPYYHAPSPVAGMPQHMRPSSVSSSRGRPGPKGPRKRDFYSALERLLKTLRSRDTYKIFADPVDTDLVTDYLTVIKAPMDFGTMHNKLVERQYKTFDEFAKDVELVTGNAMIYNAKGTIYYNVAEKLERWFHKHAPREIDGIDYDLPNKTVLPLEKDNGAKAEGGIIHRRSSESRRRSEEGSVSDMIKSRTSSMDLDMDWSDTDEADIPAEALVSSSRSQPHLRAKASSVMKGMELLQRHRSHKSSRRHSAWGNISSYDSSSSVDPWSSRMSHRSNSLPFSRKRKIDDVPKSAYQRLGQEIIPRYPEFWRKLGEAALEDGIRYNYIGDPDDSRGSKSRRISCMGPKEGEVDEDRLQFKTMADGSAHRGTYEKFMERKAWYLYEHDQLIWPDLSRDPLAASSLVRLTNFVETNKFLNSAAAKPSRETENEHTSALFGSRRGEGYAQSLQRFASGHPFLRKAAEGLIRRATFGVSDLIKQSAEARKHFEEHEKNQETKEEETEVKVEDKDGADAEVIPTSTIVKPVVAKPDPPIIETPFGGVLYKDIQEGMNKTSPKAKTSSPTEPTMDVQWLKRDAKALFAVTRTNSSDDDEDEEPLEGEQAQYEELIRRNWKDLLLMIKLSRPETKQQETAEYKTAFENAGKDIRLRLLEMTKLVPLRNGTAPNRNFSLSHSLAPIRMPMMTQHPGRPSLYRPSNSRIPPQTS